MDYYITIRYSVIAVKQTFHHKLVNDQFGDPCLIVRLLREGRSFLFDAGDISSLSLGDLVKVTDVFITHMHIDHFIGFDMLLRNLLRRTVPLRVYGPEGIIECINGKLKGYSWNLIEEYPMKIEVFDIGTECIRHSSFYAENRFEMLERPEMPFNGVIMKEPLLSVRAANFSHGIPCLGFSMEEEFHMNIDKAALNRRGLPVGPWLGEFKRLFREKTAMSHTLKVGDRELRFSDLMEIVRITEGQKISYLTDIAPEEGNISRAIGFVQGSDTLYCEAYFLHKDLEKAQERRHLTAKIAGQLAREAGVNNLKVMHFSPRYRQTADDLEAEALREFQSQGDLTSKDVIQK